VEAARHSYARQQEKARKERVKWIRQGANRWMDKNRR
jgi:hypothetical protein